MGCKEDIENSKYSMHEILTMASIIEMETMKDEDRKDVASDDAAAIMMAVLDRNVELLGVAVVAGNHGVFIGEYDIMNIVSHK